MTDPTPTVSPILPPVTPPVARSGRGLQLALAVSVGLNLAVAGLVAGAWLKDGPHVSRGANALGFGAFSAAFDPSDRRALRKALRDKGADMGAGRTAGKAEFASLVAALRREPFNQAAVELALAAIADRNQARLELGRSLIESHLLAMSPADRLAFADRLEAALGQEH